MVRARSLRLFQKSNSACRDAQRRVRASQHFGIALDLGHIPPVITYLGVSP